jgi:hypothetical protein
MINPFNMLAVLSPMERVAAVRDALVGASVAWRTWLPAVAAVVAGLTLLYLYRHWYDRRRTLRSFIGNAARLGLTHDERTLLARLARLAELKRLDAIFGLQPAFDRGTDLYLSSRRAEGMSDVGREELVTVLDSLRDKLGFAQEAYARQRESAGTAFHRVGSAVRVTRRGRQGAIEGTIRRAGPDGVTVELAMELDARAGEAWRLRHVDRIGQHWEFDAVVMAGAGREAMVRLIGEPRCINLRRSVRVPTHMPAYLAAFPFVRGTETTVPQFVSGTLTEIGGSGLRVDSALKAEVGQRVLTVIKGHEERMIQGVAKVRRVVPGEGSSVIVLEMVGLADDEVGTLVQETNRAARRAQLSVREPALAVEGGRDD